MSKESLCHSHAGHMSTMLTNLFILREHSKTLSQYMPWQKQITCFDFIVLILMTGVDREQTDQKTHT